MLRRLSTHRLVGRNFDFEFEGESVGSLSLVSDAHIYSGLIRHHTEQEKQDILLLIFRLKQLRILKMRCTLFNLPMAPVELAGVLPKSELAHSKA
jgi:hypothetical protein